MSRGETQFSQLSLETLKLLPVFSHCSTHYDNKIFFSLQGCTSDVFKCTHIYVQFVELIDDNVNFTFPYNATIEELANFTTEIEKTTTESVLQVNIKGCGCECHPSSVQCNSIKIQFFTDPPSVRCKNFTDTFGFQVIWSQCHSSYCKMIFKFEKVQRKHKQILILQFFSSYQGAVFPCFYSKKNKTVVMTSYSRNNQVNTIIHFFVVPFIITVISSIGICIIHCNCSCKKERPKYRRPRIENIRHVSLLFDQFLRFSFANVARSCFVFRCDGAQKSIF